MKLRIALSYVAQKLNEIILKSKQDPRWTIQENKALKYFEFQFRMGIGTLEKITTYSEYSTVLVNLPKAQIIVLIFAYKLAMRHSEFNFETIYQSY